MSFATVRCEHSHDGRRGGAGDCPSCKYHPSPTLSLFTAAEYGRLEDVRRALTRHSVNAVDASGYTALHYAAQRNHVEVVAFLLARGAVADGGTCGATPLHRAAAAGSLESVRLLVEAGADLAAKDVSFGDNKTPLEKAQAYDRREVVSYLLERSASVADSDRTSNR